MYRVIRKEIIWWACGLTFLSIGCSQLIGCSQELRVDEFQFTCEPDTPGQCGSGYVCRPVPGKQFSACYELGSEPRADASTGDAADTTAIDTGTDVALDTTPDDVGADGDTSGCGSEICGDFQDNDCDGVPENGCQQCVHLDTSQGACGRAVENENGECIPPPDFRTIENGCDTYPNGQSMADGIDNDCNGLKDEAVAHMVTTGDYHGCLLSRSQTRGQVYCWGLFGSETTDKETLAVRIPLPPSLSFTKISAGGNHTCALAENGEVFCWGQGTKGQLGNGLTLSSDDPVKVVDENGQPMSFEEIASGGAHTCGISRDMTASVPEVFCWGENDMVQLGVVPHNASEDYEKLPTKIEHDWGGKPISLSLGDKHSCVVVKPSTQTPPHRLWCWGANGGGQAGQPVSEDTAIIKSPMMVEFPGDADLKRIDGGFAHTCAVVEGGDVFCWGLNESGQLGTGNLDPSPTPTKVNIDANLAEVRVGFAHTCAITNNSTPMCWGADNAGQVTNDLSPPHQYLEPKPVTVASTALGIDIGKEFTCAITAGNIVRCWGMSDKGQLGTGEMHTQISLPPVVCARSDN